MNNKENERDKFDDLAIEQALMMLKSKNVFNEIAGDMESLGCRGKSYAKITGYIAAASRKNAIYKKPLVVSVKQPPEAGMNNLSQVLILLTPEEDLAGFFPDNDTDLKYFNAKDMYGKFCVYNYDELYGLEKELLFQAVDSGEINHLGVVKDENIGEKKARHFHVEIRSSFLISLKESKNNEKILRRSLVINDYSEIFRDKVTIKKDTNMIIAKHHMAQRLLKPLKVFIPFVKHIGFPVRQLQARRDFGYFMDLMSAICFIKQYQKKINYYFDKLNARIVEWISCDIEDYSTAYYMVENGVLPSMSKGDVEEQIDFFKIPTPEKLFEDMEK